MTTTARASAVCLAVVLGLTACPDEKPIDRGAELERSVKERVDRDRPWQAAVRTASPPKLRIPDLESLTAPSTCHVEQRIPMIAKVAPSLCFGQSVADVTAADPNVWLGISKVPGQTTARIPLAAIDSAWSTIELTFDADALAAVTLQPVEFNQRNLGPAIVAALNADLGEPSIINESLPGPFGMVVKRVASTWHYRSGPVHGYVRLEGPTWSVLGPVDLWLAKPSTDEKFSARFANEEAAAAARASSRERAIEEHRKQVRDDPYGY